MKKQMSDSIKRRIRDIFSGKNYNLLILILVIILTLSMILSISIGRYQISLTDLMKTLTSHLLSIEKSYNTREESVIFVLRLPRIIAAVLVGGSLALSGGVYQGVFKNPLVSPYILGVSSGACVGASLAIIFSFNATGIQVFAFLFGIITVLITTTITKFLKSSSVTILVLSGVIVNGFMSAIMGIINYIADPEDELPSIVYWQMGSLEKISISSLVPIAIPMIIVVIIIIRMRWQINLLSLGESEAKFLGVNVKKTRGLMIIFSTFLTASAVCLCGTIGWVGLVIPHLGRIITGHDNLKSIPVSFIMGAIFMVIIDTTARSITSLELPISILTGIIGTPFFLIVLMNQKGKVI
ncbi:FecCD family ABC transporter permease [Eubacteriales bacterium KG127]